MVDEAADLASGLASEMGSCAVGSEAGDGSPGAAASSADPAGWPVRVRTLASAVASSGASERVRRAQCSVAAELPRRDSS